MRFEKSPSYFMQYLGLKAACLGLRLLPYNAACALGRGLTGLAPYLMKKRFTRNIRDIQLAFPEKSEHEARQIARQSWRNMGQILAEFVKLSSYSREEVMRRVQIRGLEKLQKADAAKTGGIIHIGHFTDWEAFGLGVSAAGIDSIVMAQRVDNPYVDEETNRLRHIFGGFTIYSNHDAKPFFATMRVLKKGRMLGILTDQNVVSGEIFMHFLGRPAAISPITALLAIRQKVPIFPVVVTRENGRLVCTVEDPIITDLEYSMENVRLLTRQLTDIYERWIRQNPGNWLWAHNRWKREEEAKHWFAEHPECQIK